VTAALVVVVSFCSMELVSYAAHRWLMHGAGMAWHRSHHAPARGRLERNDLFPMCFSVVGVALFAVPALGWGPGLFWVGTGVTAYGVAYLFVHEVYIHRRVAVPVPSLAYLEWLRAAHREHHRSGGEPYGMLLPIVRRTEGRGPVLPGGRDPLDRAARPRSDTTVSATPAQVGRPPGPSSRSARSPGS
jgi:beta-carotene 3-hydroxylase